MTIRVLLADDQNSVRASFAMLVSSDLDEIEATGLVAADEDFARG